MGNRQDSSNFPPDPNVIPGRQGIRRFPVVVVVVAALNLLVVDFKALTRRQRAAEADKSALLSRAVRNQDQGLKLLKPERACRSWRGINMSNLIPRAVRNQDQGLKLLKPERACRSWRGINMSNLIPTGFIVVTAACAALFSAIAVAMGRL
jgi:hypothetical protein